MNCHPFAISAAILLLLSTGRPAHGDVLYTGTNLAGAEFGEHNLPGTFGIDYTYPTPEEVDYYISKGMNVFRVPFRWERLQPALFADFNVLELQRLTAIVDNAIGKGAHVILDPHNYARYHDGVIGGSIPTAAFTDFWTRLANVYADDDRVILGLMNEPNTMPTEQWAIAAQAAINAIRATGAVNLILVPGNAWTGAHSWLDNWYGTPNADVMLGITDPADNFAFEVHQYLDDDSSGTSIQIVSADVGQQRLVDFTAWLRTHDRKGFLGEFAAGNATIGAGIGDEAIGNMLDYIDANDDVWLGWTWWAGGPWWGDDIFTLEPLDLGLPSETDRPVMGVLEPYLVGGNDWTDLGGGLAGALGIPSLQGQGALMPSSTFSVLLESALPNAPAAIVVGDAAIDLPLFGGVLVPAPTVIVGFETDGQGAALLSADWLASSPPGTQLFFQIAVIDAATVQGIALSNAALGTQI